MVYGISIGISRLIHQFILTIYVLSVKKKGSAVMVTNEIIIDVVVLVVILLFIAFECHIRKRDI